MRAGPEDGDTDVPADEVRATVLGPDPSPLAVLEGTASLLQMDRGEVGTPLGDLEGLADLGSGDLEGSDPGGGQPLSLR